MDTKALELAISLAGSQSALAERIGKKQSHVWSWMNRDRKCPSAMAIPVASAVGYRVTPHELRPDIYPHPHDGLPEAMRKLAS